MPVVPLSMSQIRNALQSGYSLSPAQFTYSIPGATASWETTPGNYTGSNQQPSNGYSTLSEAQGANFVQAIGAWDELILRNFTTITDSGATHGEVRIAFTSWQMEGSTAGYAFQGSNKTPNSIVGDIWLNSNSTAATFARGTQDYQTMLHELGHVLCFQHSFDEGKPGETVIPAPYETTRYTIMSYTAGSTLVTFGGGGNSITSSSTAITVVTPMVLDIAYVQDLYGADPTTRSGDTTYIFNQTDTFLQSIYDAGGIDTLDLSAIIRPNIVDIRPGAYSSIASYSTAAQAAYWKQFYSAGLHSFIDNALAQPNTYTWNDNLGIAFGTVIENVIGGLGDDIITGNAANNLLRGMGGNDTLIGGAGNDTLWGGSGTDIAQFTTARAAHSLFAYGGEVAVLTAGTHETDRLFEIETMQFSDGSFATSGVATFAALDYVASHRDLALGYGANGAAGFQHYINHGFFEGRAQDTFDELRYGASNSDLAAGLGTNRQALLEHYLTYGIVEGRPVDSFDTLLYGASNSDLAAGLGTNRQALLTHYLTYGVPEGRPTSGFDVLLYGASNSDLAAGLGTNRQALLEHYLTYGIPEGRPTSGFDTLLYGASNSDLAIGLGADRQALLAHYLNYGIAEGRPTSGFDAYQYIASNWDLLVGLRTDAQAATYHYLEYGIPEGRAVDTFDAAQYLANYADLRFWLGNDEHGATLHYINYGYDEGRTDDAIAM